MKTKTKIANRFKKISTGFSKALAKTKNTFNRLYLKLPKPVQGIFTIFKTTVSLFRSHSTGTLGAGLSYYMVFSIAPILVIIISLTGAILGHDAVTGNLSHQIEGVLGAETAKQLQEMVKSAYQPGKTWIATVLSSILLLFGAIGVFDELRDSLNIIWDVPPTAKKNFMNYLLKRLFSFGMLACLAFLLLVSLVLQGGLAAFSGYVNSLLPGISKILLAAVEFIVSFGISTVLFAFIYKFMSDIKISFRLVWPGALFTAGLFAIGKYAIGLYISQSHLANTYGAASSLIVLLLWIFYSSQIVFFGAEFTRAFALHRGIKIVPVRKK